MYITAAVWSSQVLLRRNRQIQDTTLYEQDAETVLGQEEHDVVDNSIAIHSNTVQRRL